MRPIKIPRAPFPNYRMPESNIRFDARQAITNWNRTSFEGSLPGGGLRR